MRVALELTELTDVMREVEFKVFREAANLKDGASPACACPRAASCRAKTSTI